ncbi:MAG: tetratricopeptide repeat protein [Gallionellaceae bacterium]|nr:tetratricopeptide repeat protein [Gallionellaceae bacterium]
MSVINQVLSDLEKRGAAPTSSDAVIRAVPIPAKRNKLWLVVVAGVVGLVVVGWWKNQSSPPSAAMLTSQPIVQEPAPVVTQESPLAVPNESPPVVPHQAAPAMRLSFELSSIPLPSSLRAPLHKEEKGENVRQPLVSRSTDVVMPNKPDKADKQIKQFSPQQKLDNEFRKATTLLQQGRSNEAYSAYELMLQRDAGYDAARQAMVGILLEGKRNAEAERVLEEGLQYNIKNSGFAMLLARLQVERGELVLALDTLQKTLPYAERQADYQAFIAALLQRQNNHTQAITHYQSALQLMPNSGLWLMGLGISLQAEQRKEEARAVYKRAMESNTLSAELRAFVEQRMKEL